jgi:hypothetical protein
LKADLFESTEEAPKVVSIEDPAPPAHGVVVKVEGQTDEWQVTRRYMSQESLTR